MPVLTGDDIAKINDFALEHEKEWRIIDNYGGGVRISFKDNRAYIYKQGVFGTAGGWNWEDNNKDAVINTTKEDDIVEEPEQTPEEEVESEESKE